MRCFEVSDHLKRSLCSQKRLRKRRRLLGVSVLMLSIPFSLPSNSFFLGMGVFGFLLSGFEPFF